MASRSTGRATSCGRCGSPTRVTRSRRTSRPALLPRASTVRSNAFLHYHTGALLDGAHDFSDGAPDAGAGREQPHRNLHIHRADLHDALARELEQRSPGAVRLGRRLVDVAQSNDSVTAAFAGDGSATGDLLVGADGLRSRVRELLWGQEIPRFTGQVAFRFLVPAAAAPPFVDHVGRAAVYFGPDRVFNRYGLRRGAIVNGVAIARTDSWHGEAWTTPATTAELLDLYEGWHPDVLGLIAAAPAPTKWALYDREPLPCWGRGRVTLLGDAAHPMLPFLGLGSAMAVEDASVLGHGRRTRSARRLIRVARRPLGARRAARCESTRPRPFTSVVFRRYNPARLSNQPARTVDARTATRTAVRHWVPRARPSPGEGSDACPDDRAAATGPRRRARRPMTAERVPAVVDLDEALRPGAIVPFFQPIVDLHGGTVRAYEALARWPRLPGLTPDVVFALARAATRLVELDWMCRVAALDATLAVHPGDDVAIFVNVEPASLSRSGPDLLARRWARDVPQTRLVLELTERSMLLQPAGLLRFVARARDEGMGVALNDVGADPDSLAMLDLVAPDIVKLDLELVQAAPAQGQARTLAAVMAHQERTGAAVLAEGIETPLHLEQAVAFGADLGQGWLFGRPAPLPDPPVRAATPLRFQPLPPRTGHSPFDVVRRHLPIRTATKPLLVQMSRHIEELALNTTDSPIVLTAVQAAAQFDAAGAREYGALARTAPLVAVFACDIDAEPAPGVRGVRLTADDPLAREWSVVVLGARTAAALIARDCGDTGAEVDRRFNFAITHDRSVVTQAARALLDRLGTTAP